MTIEEFLPKVQVHLPGATREQVERVIGDRTIYSGMAKGVADEITSTQIVVSTPELGDPPVKPPTIVPKTGRRSLAQRKQEMLSKSTAAEVQQQQQATRAIDGVEGVIQKIYQARERKVDHLSDQIAMLVDPDLLQQDVLVAAHKKTQGQGVGKPLVNPWDSVSVGVDVAALMDGYFDGIEESIVNELAEGSND